MISKIKIHTDGSTNALTLCSARAARDDKRHKQAFRYKNRGRREAVRYHFQYRMLP